MSEGSYFSSTVKSLHTGQCGWLVRKVTAAAPGGGGGLLVSRLLCACKKELSSYRVDIYTISLSEVIVVGWYQLERTREN